MKISLKIVVPVIVLTGIQIAAAEERQIDSWPAVAEFSVDQNFKRVELTHYPIKIQFHPNSVSLAAVGKHAHLKIKAGSEYDLKMMIRVLSVVPTPFKIQLFYRLYDYEEDQCRLLGFYFHRGVTIAQNEASLNYALQDPLIERLTQYWLPLRFDDILPDGGIGCHYTLNTCVINSPEDEEAYRALGGEIDPSLKRIYEPCGKSVEEKAALELLLRLRLAGATETPTQYIQPSLPQPKRGRDDGTREFGPQSDSSSCGFDEFPSGDEGLGDEGLGDGGPGDGAPGDGGPGDDDDDGPPCPDCVIPAKLLKSCSGEQVTVHSFANCTHCNDQILQAGAKFDMNNPVVKELCAYAYQVEKQLQNTGQCFVYQTAEQAAERSACARAWLAFMKLSDMKLEIDPGQALGHVPDTCAGGNPDAGGCFIPMNSRCNSHIGSTCPMRSGQCYNKVIFRIEDGAGNWWEVDCSSVSSQQKSAWTTAINKRKSEFACKLSELVAKMNDLYGDYADWPASPSPPTGVVSLRTYIETCLCCVIPVDQKLDLEP